MSSKNRYLRVGIIGIGGYAKTHHDALAQCRELGYARLEATVVHQAEQFPEEYRRAKESGARLYASIEEMLAAEEGRLDLITVPTGISDHAAHSIMAMEAGFHVFCEKPAAAALADATVMREASRRTGKRLIIGYQHLLSPGIQRAKAIRLKGDLGALNEIRTSVCWPRSSVYYSRNSWAGALTRNGRPVYDSPVQNATAHFMQNMLYVAGTSPGETALPRALYGEQYRAQEIESADTQFIRGETADGVRLTYAATHACLDQIDPATDFLFSRGRIRWHARGAATQVYLTTRTGEELIEEIPPGRMHVNLKVFIDAAIALSEGRPPVSTIENAWQHTALVESLFEHVPIRTIEKSSRKTHRIRGEWFAPDTAGENTVIPGIEKLMDRVIVTGLSFHELGAPWATEGSRWELQND